MPAPSPGRPNLAVVSSNGLDVDLHLGHAVTVLIYGPGQGGLPCLLETRSAPEPGAGPSRWKALARTLKDCFALVAASAGDSPRQILGRAGLPVLIAQGQVQDAVDVLYGGGT